MWQICNLKVHRDPSLERVVQDAFRKHKMAVDLVREVSPAKIV